ncbi:MAG: class I SAM-dependent methyltransferase [Opitutaceae bacterium]
MSLLRLAQSTVARVLTPGCWAVDATAGRGSDTCFLAHAVGPEGRVVAFDLQAEALASTRERLERESLVDRVHLVHASHARLSEHLPELARGRLAAVMFNLGYLPKGGSPLLITRPESTLLALEQACSELRPGGVLSVVSYRGHPGGAEEDAAVAHFFASRPSSWLTHLHHPPAPSETTPVLRLAIAPVPAAARPPNDALYSHSAGSRYGGVSSLG